MDKNLAGFIGAVSAFAAGATARAEPAQPLPHQAVLEASSYADLLKPIPNAVEMLRASNAAHAEQRDRFGSATAQDVQYYEHHHHHHHHHSVPRYYPAPYPPPYYAQPYYPPVYAPPHYRLPVPHHHHHHHHHHDSPYYPPYRN